jgi:hypothetical protein
MENGVVLSVTLFLISMSQINKNVDSPTKIIGFADDCIIYTRLHSLQTAKTNIEAAVDKISSWARIIGFQISPEKTVSMHIRRAKPRITVPIPQITLELVPNHKIFGVFFDSQLNWGCHISEVKERASKKLSLANKNWGADQEKLLRVHQMIVLSLLEYGCNFYGSA